MAEALTTVGACVERARALASSAAGRRVVLGLAGAPGAGKSTVATRLAGTLRGAGVPAVVVPMDGFHLAQEVIVGFGAHERKGAPDTFDAGGFVALLRRLVAADEEVVYAPAFRREIEEPIAGAIPVAREVPVVIVEGNYLLLEYGPWADVRPLLTECWYVRSDEARRMERLVARHMEFGWTAEAARAHAGGSDQRNAELIAGSAHRADAVGELPEVPVAE